MKMNKKSIGLILVLAIIIGCIIGRDRMIVYQVKKDTIESYEDIGYLNEEYDIKFKGDTIEITEYYNSDDVMVWDEYNLGADELIYTVAEHSELIKERLDLKTDSHKYHCKIILKTYEGKKIAIVKDGEILFNYFEQE